jgi:hypothetical protein
VITFLFAVFPLCEPHSRGPRTHVPFREPGMAGPLFRRPPPLTPFHA